VAPGETKPLWELRDIVKRYPGVTANDHVSLELAPGVIHGLLGENGCGKSTLIKILAGVEQPTEGEIFKGGVRIHLRSPLEARRAGIATVFQEFSLVSDLSVAENIFLGRPLTNSFGLVDWTRINAESVRTLEYLGLAGEIDPRATIRSLSVAQQQLVEIAKAVSTNARTLILDEPTAALSLPEIERLHGLLRRLKSNGHAILYVSHRLDEVVSVIDVATVLKDGRRVRGPGEIEIAIDPIVAAMIGRDLAEYFPPGSSASDEVMFEAEGLASREHVAGVSFALHSGEVLGIAGAMGSGRTSLLRTVFGLQSAATGSMRLRHRDYAPSSPTEAIHRGVAFVPENRKSDALFFNFGGAENASIASLGKITRIGLLEMEAERASFATLSRDLAISPRAARVKVGSLSGGNQQKIVLARWIFHGADLFLLDEPTQGIDIGAKASIYQLLRKLTREGKAIVLVSSDLDELLALSDRIAVLRNGAIAEIRPADCFDKHALSVAMAGATGAGGVIVANQNVVPQMSRAAP
jgi:ribose transport system ATP-binding protein